MLLHVMPRGERKALSDASIDSCSCLITPLVNALTACWQRRAYDKYKKLGSIS